MNGHLVCSAQFFPYFMYIFIILKCNVLDINVFSFVSVKLGHGLCVCVFKWGGKKNDNYAQAWNR